MLVIAQQTRYYVYTGNTFLYTNCLHIFFKQIQGYSSPLWVTVYLATNTGTPHFHLLCGPGSTKLPCRNILLPNGIPAIQVFVSPESGMTAM